MILDDQTIKHLKDSELPEGIRESLLNQLFAEQRDTHASDLEKDKLELEKKKFRWNTPIVITLTGLITLGATYLFDVWKAETATELAVVEGGEQTKNAVTLEQLRAEIAESETRLSQSFQERQQRSEAEYTALADERAFQFNLVKEQLASELDQTERARVLLFLAKSGILSTLNVAYLEELANEQLSSDQNVIPRLSVSPISQTDSNPEPLTQAELETALEAAAAVGNDTILKIAAKEVGIREVPGPGHSPRIEEYNRAMALSFPPTDDDIPWNGQFLGWVVDQAGYSDFPNSAVSRSWETWGQSSEDAIGDWEIGCIMVAWRRSPDAGTGIAGIYIGDKGDQYVRILAGNVFNAVDAATVSRDRVTACRLPHDYKTIAQ